MLKKQKPWRSEPYKKWVRSFDCAYCGKPSDDAHHINGQGIPKAMSDKISDCHTIPLCRFCHNEIHKNKELIDQKLTVLKLLETALIEGRLVFR